MIKQTIVLVGGRGERLNDGIRFTPAVEIPKPLIEVGGKPFLTYSLDMLKGIGIRDIVLLVGYRKEFYEFLKDDIVRLVETQEDVNKAVLSIPNLQELFLLLNGDCFPIMDWRDFIRAAKPRVAVKIVGRDAGIAIVSKEDIRVGGVDCSRIGDMLGKYENYSILGGLHIGTYQGLARARLFIDIVVYGA